jgi:hypothetical protein
MIDQGQILFSNIDNFGMTVLHASSLLLRGKTPKRELTDQEKRSKRVKTYPSIEVNILEVIATAGNFDVNTRCELSTGITLDSKLYNWNAMHIAVLNNNPDLVNFLIESGLQLTDDDRFIHLISTSGVEVDIEIIDQLIFFCSENINYKFYLNEPFNNIDSLIRRPLLMAVRQEKISLIKGLISCAKVDINAVDEISGMTAFHEACISDKLPLVQAFRSSSDKIDVFSVGTGLDNCIVSVINKKSLNILNEIISMRKNDVIECLLTDDGENSSFLVRLEESNINLALSLGYQFSSISTADENSEEVELIIIKDEQNASPDDDDKPGLFFLFFLFSYLIFFF